MSEDKFFLEQYKQVWEQRRQHVTHIWAIPAIIAGFIALLFNEKISFEKFNALTYFSLALVPIGMVGLFLRHNFFIKVLGLLLEDLAKYQRPFPRLPQFGDRLKLVYYSKLNFYEQNIPNFCTGTFWWAITATGITIFCVSFFSKLGNLDQTTISILAGIFLITILVLFYPFRLNGRGWIIIALCTLAIITPDRNRITDVVISHKSLQVKLAQIQSQLGTIYRTMDSLLIAQQINALEPDNSILLDYEPMPKSVIIHHGPLVHFPRPPYGYRIEGRKIYITNDNTLAQIKARLPGAVTVVYLRKIQ